MPAIDFYQLLWFIPLVLGGIALLQLLYLAWLSYAPGSRPPAPRADVYPGAAYGQPPSVTQTQPVATAPAQPQTLPVYTPPAAPALQPVQYPPLGAAQPQPLPTPVQAAPPMPTPQPLPVAAPPPFVAPRPASTVTQKKMVVLAGVEGMTEIAIPPGNFSIGRFFNQESNVLVALDERSVSRRHAAFVSNDAAAEYSIVDTNSSYGTFLLIDNQFDQLTPGKNERVYHEDVVQFGNSVRVRLILPGETRASTTRL